MLGYNLEYMTLTKGEVFLPFTLFMNAVKNKIISILIYLLTFQDLFSETFCIFFKLINSIFIIEIYSEVVFEIFMKTVTKHE